MKQRMRSRAPRPRQRRLALHGLAVAQPEASPQHSAACGFTCAEEAAAAAASSRAGIQACACPPPHAIRPSRRRTSTDTRDMTWISYLEKDDVIYHGYDMDMQMQII